MNWSTLTRNQKIITILTILTALMHLAGSFQWFGTDIIGLDLGILFIINGIGYLVLLALLYFLPQFEDRQDLLRLGLALWAFGTIIVWIGYHPGDTLLDSSIVNKIIEVILVVFLYLDYSEQSI